MRASRIDVVFAACLLLMCIRAPLAHGSQPGATPEDSTTAVRADATSALSTDAASAPHTDATDALHAESTGAMSAEDDQRASEAYHSGDFDTARTLWLSALEAEGQALPAAERGRLLYNLGNVAFRKGATLEAVGWYTAALRVRPRDGDTWFNLEYARGEAKLEPADRGDLAATVRRLLSSLTLAESEWLVLAATLAWAGLLAGEALRGGRTWRRLALCGALFVAVCAGPRLFHALDRERDPLLVIQAGRLEVRSEPRADAAVIGELVPGTQLEREDQLPVWTKVRAANGTQGWVAKSAVFALAR